MMKQRRHENRYHRAHCQQGMNIVIILGFSLVLGRGAYRRESGQLK